jgi:hypothetical protein
MNDLFETGFHDTDETTFWKGKVEYDENDNIIIFPKRPQPPQRPQEMLWISAKDLKPEDHERVIFYNPHRDIKIDIGFFVPSQTPMSDYIYWMSLPNKPID